MYKYENFQIEWGSIDPHSHGANPPLAIAHVMPNVIHGLCTCDVIKKIPQEDYVGEFSVCVYRYKESEI